MCCLLLAMGCVSKKNYMIQEDLVKKYHGENSELKTGLESLARERDALRDTNDNLLKDLQSNKSELSQRVAELTHQNQEMAKQLRDSETSKAEEVSKLKSTYDELVGNMKSEIEAGEIAITQLKGKLTVNLVDRILFDSGRAEVKTSGKKVLDRVGAVLKGAQDKQIVVEGHTDNVPIGGSLKEKFPSNWELSAARALNVVHYLQEKVGIGPERLAAIGYGEYRPVAPNDAEASRQKNRRIEIVLNAAPERSPSSDSAAK